MFTSSNAYLTLAMAVSGESVKENSTTKVS